MHPPLTLKGNVLNKKRMLILTMCLILAACSSATPTVKAVVETASVTAVQEATRTPEGTASQAIPPGLIRLDTQGLPYSWQPHLIPATPYDASQPPGPTGLPEHTLITFGVTDPQDRKPGDPVMYIIPIEAYEQLWDDAGNPAVAETIDQIYKLTIALPSPPPTSGLPALPSEVVSGYNDLAVQLGRADSGENSASKSGYRFVGRWAQDANPVTNQGLFYVYQGFTNDGRYLVSFFYPVRTSELHSDTGEMPPDEMESFNQNPPATILKSATILNGLQPDQWDPPLTTLDQLVGSLEIDGMVPTGLVNGVWQWTSTTDQGEETPVANPEKYTITFKLDGSVEVTADCNRSSGNYSYDGGMVGSMRFELGATTLAECGPDSLSQQMLNSIPAIQDFKVLPKGENLKLVMPADGPVLNFSTGAVPVQ